MTRIIATLILCFSIGLFLSAIITPIFCAIRKIFFVPFIQKRIRKKAYAEGNFVVSKLVKRYVEHAPNNGHGRISTGRDIGIYEYEYKGKKYKTRLLSSDKLPEVADLWFEKNPRKAVPEDYLGFVERVWPKYYLLFTILITIIIFISRMVK